MSSTKLHGRAFYESIGSPKHIVAPMVDQSEFAWRMLTRSFMPSDSRTSILTYSPMLHAKLFTESSRYRLDHFKPLRPPLEMPSPADADVQKQQLEQNDAFLDGHPQLDRPLFVQFCANEPDILLAAAKIVAPYCDAVDLNLGCPQGIAKRGGYGAFLQEDWPRIHAMISALHGGLSIPVTAKMRILETKEKTLDYAKMILSAGASILTVHGRQREQKGHNTGLADWSVIRYLRDNLPPETVMFANGNILEYADLQACMDATGVDGIMSAEANLFDPSIFTPPPNPTDFPREYWQGRNGKGGWRMDAMLRRYLDIVYKHVLNVDPPQRSPLWIPADGDAPKEIGQLDEDGPPPTKKQKREVTKETPTQTQGKREKITDVNQTAMQAHIFNILRAMIPVHTNVRDALARVRVGEMELFEKVLRLTEHAVQTGILEYEKDPAAFDTPEQCGEGCDEQDTSIAARRRCRKPFFICQPHIRPSPKEAMAKGSLQLSKKTKRRLEAQQVVEAQVAKDAGVSATGKVEIVAADQASEKTHEIPKEGLVCG